MMCERIVLFSAGWSCSAKDTCLWCIYLTPTPSLCGLLTQNLVLFLLTMYTHAYLRPSMMTRKQCTIAWPPALTTIAEGWIKRSRRCAMRWRPRKAAGINCRYSSVSFRPRHVPHIHCAFLSLPLFPLSPVLLISFKNPYFAPLLPPRRLLH